MQDQKDISKLRHPGTGMGGYLGYQWGARSENFLTEPFLKSPSLRQHRSDSYPLTHKLNGCVHPRLIKAADQVASKGFAPLSITLGYNQVEWSVLKLHWVAKELLIRNGANLQVSSMRKVLESAL